MNLKAKKLVKIHLNDWDIYINFVENFDEKYDYSKNLQNLHQI